MTEVKNYRNNENILKLTREMNKYFKEHTDLYQLAIDRMLEAQDFVVAIVPETYINSKFFNKHFEFGEYKQ